MPVDESDFEFSLYESLRDEVEQYLHRVPALWLQKFVLLGAVAAFLLTNRGDIAAVGGASTGMLVGSFLVALISMLIDLKILEYGIHARIISAFIETRFNEPPVLRDWERTLWGYGSAQSRALVRIRSWTTVLVTAVPTVVVLGLVAWLLFIQLQHWGAPTMVTALAVLYAAGSALIARRVLADSSKLGQR